MSLFQPEPFTLTAPALNRLYLYWNRKRGERAMPLRQDIDPVELGYILGHLNIIDVLRDPLHFRVRLHGTELVRREGEDRTGKTIEELPQAEFRSFAHNHFSVVAETGLPHRSLADGIFDGRIMNYEALLLPLSEHGHRVDQILIGTVHR